LDPNFTGGPTSEVVESAKDRNTSISKAEETVRLNSRTAQTYRPSQDEDTVILTDSELARNLESVTLDQAVKLSLDDFMAGDDHDSEEEDLEWQRETKEGRAWVERQRNIAAGKIKPSVNKPRKPNNFTKVIDGKRKPRNFNTLARNAEEVARLAAVAAQATPVEPPIAHEENLHRAIESEEEPEEPAQELAHPVQEPRIVEQIREERSRAPISLEAAQTNASARSVRQESPRRLRHSAEEDRRSHSPRPRYRYRRDDSPFGEGGV
jgi:hypothetical protein